MPDMNLEQRIQEARAHLDAHVRAMVEWHFSPETGCPYWLDWARGAGWDPRERIRGIDDIRRFAHFDDEVLRREDPARFVPAAYRGRPYNVFETGGTTGMPKQRIGWDDYKTDYTEFSAHYGEDFFPKGGHWLMMGPTGPRRLRLAIEHLANIRGGSCYFIDLDPRWVKKLITMGELAMVRRYQEHVVDQAATILRHRDIRCLFATPKLLEALAEKISIAQAGVRAVFCGGTSMTPQYVRFLVEEVLENKVLFAPTYGNTLMGLAISRSLRPEDRYSLTYYAPQPRAILRIVDPKNPDDTVAYGAYGRVELTTMTREFFMPRFLERDEAIRRPACDEFAWDGVGDVRPFQSGSKPVVEGVY